MKIVSIGIPPYMISHNKEFIFQFKIVINVNKRLEIFPLKPTNSWLVLHHRYLISFMQKVHSTSAKEIYSIQFQPISLSMAAGRNSEVKK